VSSGPADQPRRTGSIRPACLPSAGRSAAGCSARSSRRSATRSCRACSTTRATRSRRPSRRACPGRRSTARSTNTASSPGGAWHPRSSRARAW